MNSSTRKHIATTFQSLIIFGKVREAYSQYVHPAFTHHNPYFHGDRESLMIAMEENAKQFPNKIFHVQRILEDGDLVAVHSKLQLKTDAPEIAIVHIFRFENNLIIEEWDVSQQVPEEAQNERGMF